MGNAPFQRLVGNGGGGNDTSVHSKMMIYDIWAVWEVYKITCTFLTTQGLKVPPGGPKTQKIPNFES